MSRERTLRVGTEHELLGKLEAAGLTEDDAQMVIGSRRNRIAKAVVAFVRNGGTVTREVTPADIVRAKLEGAKPTLLEADPRFLAETGEFKTSAELIVALDGVDLAYFDGYVRNTLLPGLELCQEAGAVGTYPVTPRDVRNKRNPLFRDFYDTQLPTHGFSRPVREYGALLILKLARQLRDTGDCDLNVDEYFVVLTDPLKVDAYGRQCFPYVGRGGDGLGLYYCWFYPGDGIGLDCPCLSARK